MYKVGKYETTPQNFFAGEFPTLTETGTAAAALEEHTPVYIDENGKVHDLNIPSVFMLENNKDEVFKYGNTLYVAGAISDKLLQFLRQQKQIKEITLIIRDFTKVFASMETYYAFLKKGGTMKVLQKSKFCCILWVSHIFFTTQVYGGEQT